MTPQEQQMIDGLIERVQNTQLPEKDPEAEQHIQQTLGRNPNALYILTQTVLVQSYALEQAQKQLAEAKAAIAQQQQPEPKHATSFLGSLFGSGDSRPAAPPPPPQQAQYAPVPNYAQQGYTQQPPSQPASYPPPSYGAPTSQGGGFLRGAAQTAAGVAAGALAFEGVESLMHGFGGHSGSGFGGFGGGDAPREEVINNYYGNDAGRDRDTHGFDGNNDIEDRRDDAASQTDFANTGDQDGGDQYAADDNNASADDFTSSDDDSNFDSGSDDSSFS